MGTLRLELGTSPLRTEHERLVRTALRRGDEPPEIPEDARLEGHYSELAVRIAREGWRARALHEHQSSCVFSRLLPQLIEAEASVEYKTVVLRAAMDEIRHASLCMQIVRYLGGEPVLEASLATEPLPEHAGRAPRERALRNVIFASCLSETISTSLLAEEREVTTEPRIHRVVEQLSADEILHAKLGWSYLAELAPALSDDEREGLARYLPLALGTIEQKMLAAMPVGPELPDALRAELAALGAVEGRDGREILYAVIEDVIVPRFEELGLPGRRAWADKRVA
ncbi:MAG: hypothetical protein OHK0013_17220 [Sandaracinaceae bacterium]